jgi:hypothetical protein
MTRKLVCFALFAALAMLAGAWSAAPSKVSRAAPARVGSRVRPAKKPSLANKLMSQVDFPGIDDPKTILIEALDKLAKDCKVSFTVNERAFKYEMLMDVLKAEVANPNPIPAMKARLSAVLRAILSRITVPSGATWLVRDDSIEITTGIFLSQEVYVEGHRDFLRLPQIADEETDPYPGPRFPIIHANFQNKPLADALEELAEQSDLTIIVDASVADKKSKTPVSFKARNMPLDTAVLALASMADLDFVQLDNALFVTTSAKAVSLQKAHARLRSARRGKESEEERLLRIEEELTDRIGKMILEGRLKGKAKDE